MTQKRSDGAGDAVGRSGKDQERLDGVIELEQQRQVNGGDGNQQHDGQVTEADLLLVVLSADGKPVARRHWSSPVPSV